MQEQAQLRAASKQRRFASIEHLNPEAVAAYVDEELSPSAVHRVHLHMLQCPECREEVRKQLAAAVRLRACQREEVRASSDLLARLQSIASSCPEGPTADDLMDRATFLRRIDEATRNFRKLARQRSASR